MKYFKIASAFAIAALIFAGCKPSTSPSGTTTTPGSMVATVNGSAWSSTVIPEVSGGAKAYKNGSILTITGISAIDNSQITVELYNPAIGSDSLGTTGDNAFYSHVIGVADTTVYASIPYSLTNPSAGAVTITAYDTTAKTISGTFHFVGRLATKLTDTVTVTNGSFDQVGW